MAAAADSDSSDKLQRLTEIWKHKLYEGSVYAARSVPDILKHYSTVAHMHTDFNKDFCKILRKASRTAPHEGIERTYEGGPITGYPGMFGPVEATTREKHGAFRMALYKSFAEAAKVRPEITEKLFNILSRHNEFQRNVPSSHEGDLHAHNYLDLFKAVIKFAPQIEDEALNILAINAGWESWESASKNLKHTIENFVIDRPYDELDIYGWVKDLEKKKLLDGMWKIKETKAEILELVSS